MVNKHSAAHRISSQVARVKIVHGVILDAKNHQFIKNPLADNEPTTCQFEANMVALKKGKSLGKLLAIILQGLRENRVDVKGKRLASENKAQIGNG